MDDRYLAYKILNKIEHDNAYSNITIDSFFKEMKPCNSSFVSALVYGVIERKYLLDYNLSMHLSKPIKKLNPQVLTILRMGTYQILFMDKVPNSAAVNESVKLIKKIKCQFASGLVNSVLRKISTNPITYPSTDDNIYNLSIKYSCSYDLVKMYINDYGIDITEKILSSSLNPAPLTIRTNTLLISEDKLIEMFKEKGIDCLKTDVQNCLILVNCGSIFELDMFKKGLFHVQDKASQICIKTLSPAPNETIFDVCSAPGGKSFTISQYMNNSGLIYSFDLYPQRVSLIESGAERLKIKNIIGKVADSSQFYDDLPLADRVLCDVPCSGTGVIRRKPEIKYKDLSFIDKLTVLQYNILVSSSKYLKKNGVLVYSTCSLNKAENQDVCSKFLQNNKNFKKIPLNNDDGFTTLMPGVDDSDGFFIAKFIKE